MKAKVKLVIQDEEGNILSRPLPDGLAEAAADIERSSRGLETEVCCWTDLLDKAQSQFTQQAKKSELTCNGTSPIH